MDAHLSQNGLTTPMAVFQNRSNFSAVECRKLFPKDNNYNCNSHPYQKLE